MLDEIVVDGEGRDSSEVKGRDETDLGLADVVKRFEGGEEGGVGLEDDVALQEGRGERGRADEKKMPTVLGTRTTPAHHLLFTLTIS